MTEQQIVEIRDEETGWIGFILQHEIGISLYLPEVVKPETPEDIILHGAGTVIPKEVPLFVKILFWINEQNRPVPLATAFGDEEEIEEMTDLDLVPLPPVVEDLPITEQKKEPLDPDEPPRPEAVPWITAGGPH